MQDLADKTQVASLEALNQPNPITTAELSKKKSKKDKKTKKDKKHKKHNKKAKKTEEAPAAPTPEPVAPAAEPAAAPEILNKEPAPIYTQTIETDKEKTPAKKPATPTLKMNSVLTKDFVNGKMANFTLNVKFSGDKTFLGEPEALEKALHHLVQWENDHKKANKTGPTPIK